MSTTTTSTPTPTPTPATLPVDRDPAGPRPSTAVDGGDSTDRHHKRQAFTTIREGLCDLVDVGNSAHIPTLAAVGLCELRIETGTMEDSVLTPRCVVDEREELTEEERSARAVRNSMQRLEEQGLVERVDLRPDAARGRHDWSVTDDGWRLLRITDGADVLRQLADLEQGTDEYDALIEPLRKALRDIQELDSTTHLVTLACIAALEEQGRDTINVPGIYRTRRELLGYAQTLRTRYHSVDELAEMGFIEKRDLEPESNRRRIDIRLTEEGWRFLQRTQAIVLIRELARLLDNGSDLVSGSDSGRDPAS